MRNSILYLPSGYCNIKGILDLGMPFTFIIGGRGTGKTFTALRFIRESGIPSMLIRRTERQLGVIAKKETSPWGAVARKDGFDFSCDHVGDGIFATYEIDEEGNPTKELCKMAALSTFSNLRGFSSDETQLVVFDEFIPENHERPIKGEGDVLANLYESINRNREFEDPPRPPLRLLCMANANSLTNPILEKFGLIDKVNMMIAKGQPISIMPDRGICIALLTDSPISKKKQTTALYRALKDDQFTQMSLKNVFAWDDLSNIKSRDLKGMKPLFSIDDMTVYERKDDRSWLYVSRHSSGSVDHFSSSSDEDLTRCRTQKFWMRLKILANRIEYESYELKARILEVFL